MKQHSFLFAVWVLMVMGQVGDGYGSEAMVGFGFCNLAMAGVNCGDGR
jgi:hypothetical protein